jgi:hypothetical protein
MCKADVSNAEADKMCYFGESCSSPAICSADTVSCNFRKRLPNNNEDPDYNTLICSTDPEPTGFCSDPAIELASLSASTDLSIVDNNSTASTAEMGLIVAGIVLLLLIMLVLMHRRSQKNEGMVVTAMSYQNPLYVLPANGLPAQQLYDVAPEGGDETAVDGLSNPMYGSVVGNAMQRGGRGRGGSITNSLYSGVGEGAYAVVGPDGKMLGEAAYTDMGPPRTGVAGYMDINPNAAPNSGAGYMDINPNAAVNRGAGYMDINPHGDANAGELDYHDNAADFNIGGQGYLDVGTEEGESAYDTATGGPGYNYGGDPLYDSAQPGEDESAYDTATGGPGYNYGGDPLYDSAQPGAGASAYNLSGRYHESIAATYASANAVEVDNVDYDEVEFNGQVPINQF